MGEAVAQHYEAPELAQIPKTISYKAIGRMLLGCEVQALWGNLFLVFIHIISTRVILHFTNLSTLINYNPGNRLHQLCSSSILASLMILRRQALPRLKWVVDSCRYLYYGMKWILGAGYFCLPSPSS